MSLIKCVTTEISGRVIQVNLPEKKTLILRGSTALHLLHIVECLLGQDFTGYYWNLDKSYGFNYEEVSGESSIIFNDGAVFGKDKVTQVQGVIPNIHVIRYLSGYTIRSFYLSTTVSSFSPIYDNLTKYYGILQDTQWVRLIMLVNNVLGFEFVRLEEDKLEFNQLRGSYISVEGQKLVYSIISECFLTPDKYSRVLLLPDIDVLPKDIQVRFLEVLDNIKGHTLTLSTANLGFEDIKGRSIISFLNV